MVFDSTVQYFPVLDSIIIFMIIRVLKLINGLTT